MDLHSLISSDLDEKLRCFVCKNYLSYLPVFLCSNNQSLCGRCTVPEGVSTFKDEAFEVLSESVKFPCRYKSEGCCEELVPKDVPQHEQNCSFRVVSCTIEKPVHCEWKGSLWTLSEHCQKDHSGLIMKEDWFTMDLSVSNECDNLLKKGDSFLIFRNKFNVETRILSCAIYNNEVEVNGTKCSIVLSLKKDKRTLSLELEVTTFKEITFSDICIQLLIEGCENQKNILARMRIGDEEINNDNIKIEKYRKEMEQLNLRVLSFFKCTECHDFALPNVFCGTKCSDVFCESCVPSGVKKSKQFTEMAKLLSFPCKYNTNGCTFTSKYQQMESHELHCEYIEMNCLLNYLGECNWKGLKRNLKDHLLSSHANIIVSKLEAEREICSKYKKRIFYKTSSHLFWLMYWIDGNSRPLWTIQQIGCSKEKFKYEIDIIDGTKSGRRLLMRQNCSELTSTEDVFAKLNPCCYFEKKQIVDFCNWQSGNEFSLKFKVRIFK